jgi:hypothetical protein
MITNVYNASGVGIYLEINTMDVRIETPVWFQEIRAAGKAP